MCRTGISTILTKARKILEDAGYRWDDEGNLHYPENHVPQLHYDG